MCGRFELNTEFNNLPKVLKQDYPGGLDFKYETQKLVRPGDPVLVIKNEGKMKTTFMSWGFIPPWVKNPFDKKKQDHLMQDQKPLKKTNYLVEVGDIRDV